MHINFRKTVIPTLGSLVGSIIVLYPDNPANMTLPSRDSGVFLYVGWRILKGAVPYRDVWDHKPPLIYFIDALGLLLSPRSLLGIWLLQLLFIFLTFFFLFKALEQALGIVPAFAGAIVLTSGLLTILDRGNVTEEYALLFQALGFWLFVRAKRDDYPLGTTFWIGFCGGIAFYFKQTTIGFWIAFALFLMWVRVSQKRWPVFDLLTLLAGIVILSVILALGFGSLNALNDFWSQAFLYNFVYIGKHEGISRLVPVFIKGFLFLSQGAVLYLAMLGWMVGLVYVWRRRNSIFQVQPLILLALLNFPFEVVLITISGRSILHYYLTPLPIMAVLAAVLVYALADLLGRLSIFSALNRVNMISLVTLLTIIIFQVGQIQNYPDYIGSAAENNYAPVIKYVTDHTNPGDRVLVLGAESVVNFLAQREAPTRYVYQYPLQLLGSRSMFNEYFQEILQNKPILIIDAPGSNQLDENLYKPLQLRSAIVRDGVSYLIHNYHQVAALGDWTIYSLDEHPQPPN